MNMASIASLVQESFTLLIRSKELSESKLSMYGPIATHVQIEAQGLSLYHYLYVQAPSAVHYCARKHGFDVLAKCIVKCAFYIDAEPSFIPIRACLPLLPQGRVWDLRHAIPAMRPARHWVRKL